MRVPPRFRIFVDVAMTSFMVCAFAFRITGDFAHEWIGLCAVFAFIVHNAINLTWYARTFSGRYNARRVITLLVNTTLALSALIMLITGLMNSRHVLAFLELSGGMELRQLHTSAAYWLFVLVSIHLGMHWDGVLAMCRIKGKKAIIVADILSFILAVCGAYFFVERDMFSKLFLGYSFDFWDPSRPPSLFFFAYVCMIVLIAFIVRNVLKFCSWLKKR